MTDRENALIDRLRTSLFKGRAICDELSEELIPSDIDVSLADATLDYINEAITALSDYEMSA